MSLRLRWIPLLAVLVLFLLAPARHAIVAAPVTYPAGWNLIAVPPGTDISAAQNPLYTLQPGDTDYERIAPGQASQSGLGYWAYFATPTTLQPTPGTFSPYTVTASPGQYIMIGDPNGVLAASVTGSDDTLTYDPASNYQHTTTLDPGQGAWAYSASGGTITVSPIPPQTSSPALTLVENRPLGALPGGPGRYTYTFYVSGIDGQTVRPDIRNARLVQAASNPTTGNASGGFSTADDPHLVLVFVLESAAPGDYVVTVPLTSGATLTATFTHAPAGSPGAAPAPAVTAAPTAEPAVTAPATASGARTVQFVQSYAPGTTPPGTLATGLPTDRWYYTFRISGPPISGPIGDTAGHGVTLQPPVGFGWGRTSDPNLIWVSLTPSTPGGTYTVNVMLPEGTISTTFKHPGG